MQLEKYIRNIPDYPKPGIQFKDITTLFKEPEAFRYVVETFAKRYKEQNIDVIAGIESRGFILGAAIAFAADISFVPIRKKGKLPAETISREYSLEYGTDCLEIHKDSIKKDAKVVLVDDLMATGGTMFAGIDLVEALEAKISEVAFVIDLPDLGGSKKIENAGYKHHSLISFEGL